MKNLVIIGAGDFGREVAALVDRINHVFPTWNLMGFLDDNKELNQIDGYPVLGNLEWLEEHKDVYTVCSVGTGSVRKKLIEEAAQKNSNFATLIDPDAIVMKDSSVRTGSIICAGSILAINAQIGSHVIINLGCTIGHDDRIDDFCTINPGVNISGKVHLSECVDVGTGSKIIQGKTICEGVVLGAGSVIVKDIDVPGTYVGVPAKRLEK